MWFIRLKSTYRRNQGQGVRRRRISVASMCWAFGFGVFVVYQRLGVFGNNAKAIPMTLVRISTKRSTRLTASNGDTDARAIARSNGYPNSEKNATTTTVTLPFASNVAPRATRGDGGAIRRSRMPPSRAAPSEETIAASGVPTSITIIPARASIPHLAWPGGGGGLAAQYPIENTMHAPGANAVAANNLAKNHDRTPHGVAASTFDGSGWY